MTHEIRGVRVEKYTLFCQQTSPKRWFGNMYMTSNCDVTNSAHQIKMTTIWPWTKNPHENFLRTPLLLLNVRQSFLIRLGSYRPPCDVDFSAKER